MSKLSIITVNLNNANGLRNTVQSVVNQLITDYEYIVIDGYSNDGSIEVIKEFADKIDYWVSEHDNRNDSFFESLQSQIKESAIENYTLFLGLIPRNEQLKLMKNAMAVIQPSLFEGWSTVLEDAKAMNQFIVLSDIYVHKEQIRENCMFSNPEDSEDLVKCMKNVIQNNIIRREIDYTLNKSQFGQDFINIIG